MPHTDFKKEFFEPGLDATDESLDFSSIYAGKTPIYFIADECSPDTSQQLAIFQSSNAFPEFEKQYKQLLGKLNKWCANHKMLVQFDTPVFKSGVQVTTKEKPAFTIYQERLFGTLDYYSIRKAILFSEGKRSLEELLLLLSDESIMPAIKEKILLNLQQSLIVCADGTLTNIVDAKDDLKEAHAGLAFLKTNLLRTMIQQSAESYVHNIYTEKELETKDIHYVNAYCNYVANAYGIPEKQDGFIPSLNIPQWRLQRFASELDDFITPRTVLITLMNIVMDYISLGRETLHQLFFHAQKAIPWKKNSPVLKAVEQLTEKWNRRLSMLIPINSSVFVELDSEATAFVPVKEDIGNLPKVLAMKFGELFLETTNNQQFVKINKQSTLVMSNGLYWVEEGTTERALNAKDLMSIKEWQIEPKAYQQTFNTLLETLPEYIGVFFRTQLVKREQCAPRALLNGGHYTTLISMLKYGKLAKDQKTSLSSQAFTKELKKHLSHSQIFTLIEHLLNVDLVNKRTLPLLWPTILTERSGKQIVLIENLIKRKLITSSLLKITDEDPENLGVNMVWLLADYNRFSSITTLIKRQLLTREILAAAHQHGIHAGKNIVWLLAFHKQYLLIEMLLKQNLLTRELLSAKAGDESNDAAIDPIWLLAEGMAFHLINQFIEQKLITTKMLLTAPKTGPNIDRSLFWFLISNELDHLCLLLIQQNLFTPTFLDTKLPTGSDAEGVNNVWLLAMYQKFNLLMDLLERNQLTSAMLAAAPVSGENAGVNTVWIAAKSNEVAFIEALLARKLLTTELLAAVPNDEAGTNAVYELCLHKNFALVEILLNKGLLTQEIIFATPKATEHAECSVIMELIKQDQFILLARWLQQDLLTSEMMKPHAPGAIALLTSKQQNLMLNQHGNYETNKQDIDEKNKIISLIINAINTSTKEKDCETESSYSPLLAYSIFSGANLQKRECNKSAEELQVQDEQILEVPKAGASACASLNTF